MKTLTLVIDADSRNFFASQYEWESVNKELVLHWASEADYVPSKIRRTLLEDIVEWYDPIISKWADNVWRNLFFLEDFYFLYTVNIIETDVSDTIFPLKEKAKFTFFTHVCEHNEIQQFKVSTLEEGLLLWSESVSILNKQQRKILLKYVHKGKRNPVAVEGLINVWTTTYGIFHSRLTLHIVKTV